MKRALLTPDRAAFYHRRSGAWSPVTFSEYRNAVACVFLALRGLGVTHSDRIAIHAGNRPGWLYADLAAESLGAIVVGAYPNASATETCRLLEDRGAPKLVSILPLALTSSTAAACCFLFLFDIRDEVGHGLLHHPGRLHHLGQEDLARLGGLANHAAAQTSPDLERTACGKTSTLSNACANKARTRESLGRFI